VWYNTGDSISQFQRIQQAFNDVGCAAEWSVATLGPAIFWLGDSAQGHGVVWMASTYAPQRISTHAIEYIISQMSDISDAIGFTYQQEGHYFYVLTFPTGNRTLVYDMKTQLWHERGQWNTTTGDFDRHRARAYMFADGRHYVGDYENGNIYYLDAATYTDNGAVIRRERTGPHISYNNARIFFKSFELDVERGVGLTAGQGSAPVLMARTSDDGGATWSNEREMSLGALGKYGTRARLNRCGMSRDRIFRVAISDPVKCVLVGAHCDITLEAGATPEQGA
jgi:hypothetical protein